MQYYSFYTAFINCRRKKVPDGPGIIAGGLVSHPSPCYNKGKSHKESECKKMDKEVLQYVSMKTKELIDSPTCSSEAKEAAQSWLDAVGTDKEQAQTLLYIQELEEDIMPIDNLIGFAESEQGKAYFGPKAAEIAAHAKEIKANGAKYCDCPACAAVEAILEKKGDMVK